MIVMRWRAVRGIRRWFRVLPRRLDRKWQDWGAAARSRPRLTMSVIGLALALSAAAAGLAMKNAFVQNVLASLRAFGVSLAVGGPLVRTLLFRQELQQWWRNGLDDAYGRVHDFYRDIARALMPYRSHDQLQSGSGRLAVRRSRLWSGFATHMFPGDVIARIIDDRTSYIGDDFFFSRGAYSDFPATPRHFRAVDRYLDAMMRDAGSPAIVLRALRKRETRQRRAWRQALHDYPALGDPLRGSPVAPGVAARLGQLKVELDDIQHWVDTADEALIGGSGHDYHGDDGHVLGSFHTACVNSLRLTVLLLRDLHRAGAILPSPSITRALTRATRARAADER